MLKRHGESAYTPCPLCGQEAVGHLEYENGECQEGCADCLLEIAADPTKPIDRIVAWVKEERGWTPTSSPLC